MSLEDLLRLLDEEVGLALEPQDAGTAFANLSGWDSMHLLWLVTVIERETGRQVSLPDMLEAGSLRELYERTLA